MSQEMNVLFGHLRLPEFRVYRPRTIEEAVERLNSSPTSLLLSGGTSLLPMLKHGTVAVEELIDLSFVRQLHGFSKEPHGTGIGGMTRHSDLPEVVQGPASDLMKTYLQRHTSPHIANLATVGGSVGVGLSTEDLLTVGLVLDARLKLTGLDGPVDADLNAYLASKGSYRGTVVTHLVIPRQTDGWLYRFEKVSLSCSKWPLVAVAVGVRVSGQVVEDCRLSAAYRTGNVQGRLMDAEVELRGSKLSSSSIERVMEVVRKEMRPEGGLKASESYRRDVTARLIGATLFEVINA